MPSFYYKNNNLYVEQINVSDLARQFGTPSYVYSQETLEQNWAAFDQAFGNKPHTVCYAVKANPNLSILNLLAKKNSGFDIVSIGELERVLIAGGKPENIIFSGVGKQKHEIQRALEVNIYCFNVESQAELKEIEQIAQERNQIVRIALRINPNIDAKTHPYIATGLHENKFGIPYQEIDSILKNIKKSSQVKLIGIAAHIGSQLTSLTPLEDAINQLEPIIQQIKNAGFPLEHINIGGGLGVKYQTEIPPSIPDYVNMICTKLSTYPYKIIIEPGRAITAHSGILLTKVIYLKQTPYKNFAIIDAGMNDLIRPALYEAWHEIIPAKIKPDVKKVVFDIAGPICESADFLGKNRELAIEENDLLAINTTGAYSSSMSSNYNSRPRAIELLINQNMCSIIRERETISDLFTHEKINSKPIKV